MSADQPAPQPDPQPAPRPAPAPKRTRLWVRVLLVVSLALNLLFVGAVAGMAISGGPWKHRAAMADGGIGPLTRALSREDRRAIAREVRAQDRATGWGLRAHRQSLERMVVLLETTPFDADAFAAELAVTVNGLQSKLSRATKVLVSHLAEQTDAERVAYAGRIRDVMAEGRPLRD